MKSVLVLLVCLLSIISSSHAGIVTTTNSDFTIYLDEASGLFTASGKVGGSEVPILFGADASSPTPLTSFITIYSAHSDKTYITGIKKSQPDRNSIDPDIPAVYIQPNQPIESGSGYFKLTYEVANEFTAVVTISLVSPGVGTSSYKAQLQSSVLIETDITSHVTAETTYIVNYVLDYSVDTDDGPTFRTISEASARQHSARVYTDPKFDYYMLESNMPVDVAYTIVGSVNVPDAYLLEKQRNDYTTATPDEKSSIHDLYGYLFTVAPKYLSYTATDLAYLLSWSTTTFSYKGKDHEFTVSVAQGLEINNRGMYDPTALLEDAAVVHTWELKIKNTETDTAQVSFFVKTSKDNYVGDQAQQTCNDGYECTYDYFADVDCYDSECINLPVHQYCNDNNLCTVDLCDQTTKFDSVTGCAHIEMNCDDEIPCTRDWCNPLTGMCEHDNSPSVTCDDHNPCTKDICDDTGVGKCVNEADDKHCSDLFPGDKCFTHYCDDRPGEGCAKRAIDCDDQVLCTDDSCDAASGCVNTPNNDNCDDNIDCTMDICDPAVGKCMNYPTNTLCDDQDPCTTDLCDVSQGKCIHTPMECFMEDLECTLDYCVNGYCIHIADDSQCNDGVACTTDHCNMRLSECTNKPNDDHCDDGKFCTDDYCDIKDGCKHIAHKCDDGIPCSVDSCDSVEDKCVHDFSQEHVTCDDGIACTNDVCSKDLAKCIHQTIDILCDDADPCTTDRCDPNRGCIHERLYCNDENPCTIDTCDAGVCVYTSNTPASSAICDDKVSCTEDRCDANVGCINVPLDYLCNDNIACTDDVCTGANCTNTPNDFNCDDGIPCTIDLCDAVVGCVHTTVDEICDDNLTSTIEQCDEFLGCLFFLDEVKCAQETGSAGSSCKTSNATFTGCQVTYHDEWCNDNIDCTRDRCGEDGQCVHETHNEECSDDVGCTDDVCVEGVGCTHTANAGHCSDNRQCSVETCDEQYGCIIDTSLCPVENKKESCLNCRSPYTRLGLTTYEDEYGMYSADFKIQTRNDPIVPFTTVSTEGLTDNMVIKSYGPVLFGTEEYLDNGPSVVIGADSSLRLVPSQEDLPRCNEVSRGMMVVKESTNAKGALVDEMYICFREIDDYAWVRYA